MTQLATVLITLASHCLRLRKASKGNLTRSCLQEVNVKGLGNMLFSVGRTVNELNSKLAELRSQRRSQCEAVSGKQQAC